MKGYEKPEANRPPFTPDGYLAQATSASSNAEGYSSGP